MGVGKMFLFEDQSWEEKQEFNEYLRKVYASRPGPLGWVKSNQLFELHKHRRKAEQDLKRLPELQEEQSKIVYTWEQVEDLRDDCKPTALTNDWNIHPGNRYIRVLDEMDKQNKQKVLASEYPRVFCSEFKELATHYGMIGKNIDCVIPAHSFEMIESQISEILNEIHKQIKILEIELDIPHYK